jgi:hypothetical protein
MDDLIQQTDLLTQQSQMCGWLMRNTEVLLKIKQAFDMGVIDSNAYVSLINLLKDDKYE